MPSNEAAATRDGLAECYALHSGRLRGFLLKLSGRSDLADDLSQDIWLRVANRSLAGAAASQDLTTFPSAAAQWSYLATCALNRYRDWLRAQRTQSIEEVAEQILGDRDGEASTDEAVDRMAGTRDRYARLRRLRDRMEMVFDAIIRDGSPAHQTIVFGFNRPLQWDPLRIVEQHSAESLQRLATILCADIAEAFQHSGDRSAAIGRALQPRLQAAVHWEHVQAPRAGLTELQVYYKKKDRHGRAKEVTQWSLAVYRRIIKQLLAVNAVPVRKRV
jgi:DNA-directed RNA polymerase specialized sigma24 family protein